MAHQVSSSSSSKVASPMHQSYALTPEQCQQLLALFGASNSSLALTPHATDSPMASATSSCTSANLAMVGIDFSHSVFAAQVVNRRAYGGNTWVLDTGAIDHFVCSIDLLTSITAIRHAVLGSIA